jgi:hypothetical protein
MGMADMGAQAGAARGMGGGMHHMAPAASLMGGHDAGQPLYVMVVEPGFKQQIWRTLRFAVLIFLGISGISAIFDDRGVASKLMMSTNLHMAESSDKRFADVMGVGHTRFGSL